MAYTKYSLTPANNTAAPPDGAPEGMLPSAVNDTMRDMMAQIRDCGDGIRDGTYTMTAPKITGGTITGSTINNSAIGGTTAAAGKFTTLEATGATTFSGATVVSGSLTANTFSSSGATITGGTITGITDLTGADGGTGASSITANSVILGNGSSALSGNLVAPGTSGNVLTSDGSTWTSAAGAYPLTSGTSVASTSGTSIDFTSIPSWVKRVTVMFDGVSWNSLVTPLIQLGDSGGIETTGYISIAGATSTAAGASATTSTTGFGVLGGWSSGDVFYGSIIFSLLNASTNTWAAQGNFSVDTSSTDWAVFTSGTKSLSATLDRVRITSSAAITFDAGTINILYE
jgi:hypothetical protein